MENKGLKKGRADFECIVPKEVLSKAFRMLGRI
jgi:hypothetical protein